MGLFHPFIVFLHFFPDTRARVLLFLPCSLHLHWFFPYFLSFWKGGLHGYGRFDLKLTSCYISIL